MSPRFSEKTCPLKPAMELAKCSGFVHEILDASDLDGPARPRKSCLPQYPLKNVPNRGGSRSGVVSLLRRRKPHTSPHSRLHRAFLFSYCKKRHTYPDQHNNNTLLYACVQFRLTYMSNRPTIRKTIILVRMAAWRFWNYQKGQDFLKRFSSKKERDQLLLIPLLAVYLL